MTTAAAVSPAITSKRAHSLGYRASQPCVGTWSTGAPAGGDIVVRFEARALSRYRDAHLGLGVLDQLAAHIHGHAVERAGELERRLVVRGHRRATIGAAHDAATESEAEGHRERNVGLPDQPPVDVELPP